jgi:hypothetical protein
MNNGICKKPRECACNDGCAKEHVDSPLEFVTSIIPRLPQHMFEAEEITTNIEIRYL